MKREFSLKILHKIFITLLAVSLLPLSVLWYLGQSRVDRELQRTISANMEMVLGNVAQHINDWDGSNQRALRSAAQMNDIVSMNAERQIPVLVTLGKTYEWSYLLFAADTDGKSIGRNDNGPVVNFSDRSYFQQVARGAEFGRDVVIGKTTGRPALMLATAIRNAKREQVGTLAMAMGLEDVSRAVAGIHIGTTGHAVLIDANNKVIAKGGADKRQAALEDFGDHPALRIADIGERLAVYTVNGRQMVGTMRKLPQGWRLLIEQDYDEAYAPLAEAKRDGAILFAVVLVLVIGASFGLGRQLSDPIVQLTAAADELSTGRLDVKIDYRDRKDEIGSLARSIDRMGVSLRKAMDRLRKQA